MPVSRPHEWAPMCQSARGEQRKQVGARRGRRRDGLVPGAVSDEGRLDCLGDVERVATLAGLHPLLGDAPLGVEELSDGLHDVADGDRALSSRSLRLGHEPARHLVISVVLGCGPLDREPRQYRVEPEQAALGRPCLNRSEAVFTTLFVCRSCDTGNPVPDGRLGHPERLGGAGEGPGG